MTKIQNSNHIIMVDDSEIDMMLMKRYLSKSQLQNDFLWFSSGKEFLAYMDDTKQGTVPMPALVFLDINMPQMDGFEVLKILRDDIEFEVLPVVTFLTNSDRLEDIERCQTLNAGMQEKFSDSNNAVNFLNSLMP